MTSISKTTVVTFKQILHIELKPNWMETILLNEVMEAIKFQKLVFKKDFLEQCVRQTICLS